MLAIANALQPNTVVSFGTAGSIESIAGAHLASDRAYSHGVSSIDVDGDGRQDLFVANYDAANVLYLTRDGPRLDVGAIGEALQGPASKGHAWGDYDLDARIDLYLGNGTPGRGAPGPRDVAGRHDPRAGPVPRWPAGDDRERGSCARLTPTRRRTRRNGG